ncbi:unnamed protein product [Fusarium equiseti]|uniref:Beta-lactamase-related domain-containing protein n=1 Tax=Fusarium equiseti TaxID=61235 RepID=A0A8J2IGU5_FUSEQ|nr:unnamed protein product [Fusarium equiseti]
MRLKVLGSLLVFLPSLLHAQEDWKIYERPTDDRPTVEWYFGVSENEHKRLVSELKVDNFRPMSLSAYGDPGETRYAMTWINDGTVGHGWQMAWGLNLTRFNEWVQEWELQGLRMTAVSANGPAVSAEFHAIMVEDPDVIKWGHDCDIKDIDAYMANKDSNGLARVVSFRMYGEADDRRYCVVLHENKGHERWALEHTKEGLMPDQSWSSIFNYPHASGQLLRLSKLFMSDDGVITPLVTDMSAGGWSAAIRLNNTELSKMIQTQSAQWFLPWDIQGGTGLGKTQYNAIFVERMRYLPRKWKVKGEVASFRNNKQAKEGLDKIMKNFMKENGIRQAQVAIGARGRVMAERSYTWAETTYGTVSRDDKFLLGGVSKMFLYSAVKWCVENMLFDYDTLVYELLGYHSPSDRRAEDITIQHLLDHTAGYDRKASGEAAFQFREAAMQSPSKGKKPATLDDLIKYRLKKKLDYNPGERMVHSHYGSMLLGHVVAKLTEMPYVEFLKKHVFNGLDVDVFATDANAHLKDKIHPEGLQVGIDARFPADKQHVPGAYGGDGAVKEECAAAFSLRASASTLVRFAGKHSVARMGKRRSGYRRGGVEGGYAFVESYGDDFDWAVVFNTREFASKDAVLGLVDKMHHLMDYTLSEKRYGPHKLECNPGDINLLKQDYPGLTGITPEDLWHLPDCTKEQLNKMFRGGK